MQTKLKRRIKKLKRSKIGKYYTQPKIIEGLAMLGIKNITQSYLSKLVNGVPDNPKPELMEGLAVVLKCEVEDIF